MNTNLNPQELVEALLKRSTCSVQVACVIADRHGVFAWGHNHAGADGYGQCAEAHAISRANPARLPLATLYVAARRKKSKRKVIAKPCVKCAQIVSKCHAVVWRNKEGNWCRY